MTFDPAETRKTLTDLYETAVRTALPEVMLARHLPSPPKGRLVVLAVGKAAASMAADAEAHYTAAWPATRIEGLALTRYGHTRPTRFVEVIEAGHPVPDEAGVEGSGRILDLARTLGDDDLALVLISGGGSALATLPIDGVSLEDKRTITRALLASGAPIASINCVRKHLSRFKGGRLASAIHPAPSLTLAISDVAGDDPSIIASGPTVADPTTREDALAILDRFHIDAPAPLRAALAAAPESPKPGARIFASARYELIASGAGALDAAAARARARGYEVLNLGDRVEGEARAVAAEHGQMALEAKQAGRRLAILSGGELGVTFAKGQTVGQGGPNQEYALALALCLNGAKGIAAIAGDTDGIDGGSGKADDPAGALISPDTLSRAELCGADAAASLERHDAGGFFEPLGDLLHTGPSYTNINDFRAILIEGDDT
jgi:hydroxypyruvate reductase